MVEYTTMIEQEIQTSPENGLIFVPESLQSFNHMLAYEQKKITRMARDYASLSFPKQLAFGIRSFFNNNDNERTRGYYYVQQGLQFEDKLTKSNLLRTHKLPPEKKADYILWATAIAIYKMHTDNEIENAFPDEAFEYSRRSWSRKFIQNSRRLICMEAKKNLSNDWTNNIAMKLYDPPLMESQRVFNITDALSEYVGSPVYNPDEIVFAEADNSKKR